MRSWFKRIGVGTALALVGTGAIAAGTLALALGGTGSSATVNDSQVAQNNDSQDNDSQDKDSDDGKGFRGFGGPGGPGFGPPGGFHGGGFHGYGPPSAKEREQFRKEHAKRRQQFYKDLGEELDKSPEEIEAAFKAVFKKRIEKAVKDGDLTRKQADEILKCHENESCGPPMFK
jgi:hypothetical protein